MMIYAISIRSVISTRMKMNVELVAHHGDDLLICNAARVSFAKETKWEYIEQDSKISFDMEGIPFKEKIAVLSDRDVKLINFLAREKHVLPFRHPQVTLRCKAPIFLARQLGKHQVGLSWSEESRRYIDSPPEFFWPDKWRKRAENVKQGSSHETVEEFVVGNPTPEYEEMFGKVLPTKTQDIAETVVSYAMMQYARLLEGGVAPELARMILPQNMYVNWIWTGSLLSFFEMYKLRSEGHSQYEAQQFAALIKEVVAKLYPVSWEALEINS